MFDSQEECDAMIDPKNIGDIIQNIVDELPDGLKNMPVDMQKNFRSCLQSVFEKCDLVTREEFDAQTKVLARSRKKIESLEEKVTALEKMLRKK